MEHSKSTSSRFSIPHAMHCDISHHTVYIWESHCRVLPPWQYYPLVVWGVINVNGKLWQLYTCPEQHKSHLKLHVWQVCIVAILIQMSVDCTKTNMAATWLQRTEKEQTNPWETKLSFAKPTKFALNYEIFCIWAMIYKFAHCVDTSRASQMFLLLNRECKWLPMPKSSQDENNFTLQ